MSLYNTFYNNILLYKKQIILKIIILIQLTIIVIFNNKLIFKNYYLKNISIIKSDYINKLYPNK